MIVDIGNIIIDKIKDLAFIDKYAGVVKVITMKDPSAGAASKKTFPVVCNIDLTECNKGKRYLDLCPDNTKKSVMYLEDTGLRFVQKQGNRTYWKASYNLVCWLNLKLLGQTTCSYSAVALGAILNKFPVQPFPSGNYNLVNIQLIGQQPKTVNPFSKYSYDETVNQFLMFPYDYFLAAIDVDFMIDVRCFELPALPPEVNCLVK